MALDMTIRKGIIAIAILLVAATVQLYAQSVDTVSAQGLVFEELKPAQSGTARVQKQDTPAIKSGLRSSAGEETGRQTLWAIFLAGMAGGFAALLMPCIFPMLPLTVSYFTKNAGKGSPAGKALIYGLSIIVIYVVLGLLITLAFGSDALNSLSTNGIFNFLFFVLIVVFAASFLGAFELTLPSSWANKMDENADRGGMLGLFFMAATLALVSFSCTGPIIGYLLVEAAVSGAVLGPIIGMLGFSFALAIPFALFAMFPSWLNRLPRSGGWLNSVKVTLGFLELALALKFLSNVDLAYHWHWLDRELFLSLWIVIFGLMGVYLLGKLRFSHDSPAQHISVPSVFLAILSLAFTVYMVPGLWGAPLKSISAFLPPQASQDFDLYTAGLGGNKSNTRPTSDPHKYAHLFDKPLGLDPFFDYDEGLAYAKNVNKPVMIDFTGHACVNCRKMEASIWPDKEVYQRISEEYVLIQLYVDDKTNLPVSEQAVTPEGRSIHTIGNKWSYLQTSKFKANSQPFYVLLDSGNENILVSPQGADFDAGSYLRYLDSGLKAFKK